MNNHERLDFLCQWITAPRRVGAVLPSSQALGELITSEIGPGQAPVIELGAGTGSFTRQLIARGVPESELVLIELGEAFARQLSRRYSQAHVHRIDAQRLLGFRMPSAHLAGAVISGLPLLSMSELQVARILRGAFRHLRRDGALYQFTYGPRCPVSRPLLDRLGLRARYLGRTLANVPPASVYRISRQGWTLRAA
ncbi:class I SAM-dependent methyltransferase [Pseudoxanthomonas mexicana]